MTAPKKLLIIDRFSKYLKENFEGFCQQHGFEQSDRHFLEYLIDENLIGSPELNRYTIRNEFDRLCAEQNHPKTLIVDAIADRFNISERTVWSALKNTKNRNSTLPRKA